MKDKKIGVIGYSGIGKTVITAGTLKQIEEVMLLIQEGRDNPFNDLQDDAFKLLIEAENKLKAIQNIKPK